VPLSPLRPQAQAQAAEPEVLAPRQVHRREIGGGEVHAYMFELSAHQFVSLSVNQQGSDVVVTITDSEGGRTRVDRPDGSRGREAVSYIAAKGGTYRLEVQTLETAAPRGYYEITMGEPRPATARDESRLAAERDVSEGEILRARKSAASLPQAIEKFGQAINLWQALDEPYETAVALYGRCLAHRMLGENEEAITDCGVSAETMRALGDNYGEAVARTGRAWAYIYLGEVGKASADFDESLKIRRRIGDRQGETLDLLGIGWTHVLRENYARALDYFQQSLRVLDAAGDPRGRHVRLEALGEVYRRSNRPAQAIEYLTQALRLVRGSGSDPGGEAETLTGIGWCRYTLGQLDQAQEAFAAALPIRRAVGDRTGEAATLLGLAHVEGARGNLSDARRDVDAALDIIESLRARVASQPLRLSFFAIAQDYYEFYVDLLMRMHRLNPDRGFAAAALEVSERARARVLLDLLNEVGIDVRQGLPADLLEREQSLRSRLNYAANYQRQLLSETYTAAQAAAAAKDVEELAAALGEVEAHIRHVSPRYAELLQPQPLKAAQIQSEVADGETLLLEYSLGRERSFLWAVSADGINAYELPGRQEIERASMRVWELLTARNRTVAGETSDQRRARFEAADAQYEEAAARLSRLLLTPAAGQLRAKRLVVVASGVLQLIPFGALPQPQPGGYQPLVLSHEFVTLPSASTLLLLRRESRRREPPKKLLAILADPVFSRGDERFAETAARGPAGTPARPAGAGGGRNDVAGYAPPVVYDGQPDGAPPRLFRTRWEAEQIAALAPPGEVVESLDFGANRETAVGPVVGGSRIVHFATHAILDDEHPELSGILLSMLEPDGRPTDGFLRAHDIFNLKLSADLVVLSACRTAAGKDVKGEGMMGLTRGFMYAGTPRVLGSLWATEDKATSELMVRFYRNLLRRAMRPPAALQAAQVEMLRDRRWQSPYFWAGFTLSGEWR
jgi:CHAT domain-containing protein/tetratricopeptide (TPR) repeat protein